MLDNLDNGPAVPRRPRVQWEEAIVTRILNAGLVWCVEETTVGTFIQRPSVQLIAVEPQVTLLP